MLWFKHDPSSPKLLWKFDCHCGHVVGAKAGSLKGAWVVKTDSHLSYGTGLVTATAVL